MKEIKMNLNKYRDMISKWSGLKLSRFSIQDYWGSFRVYVEVGRIEVSLKVEKEKNNTLWKVIYSRPDYKREKVVSTFKVPYTDYDINMEKAFSRFLKSIQDANTLYLLYNDS